MKAYEPLSNTAVSSDAPKSWLEQRVAQRLSTALQEAESGLLVTFPSGYQKRMGAAVEQAPKADLKLHSLKPFLRLLTGGINGWSEAYLAGEWDSSDLSALIRWGLRNEHALSGLAKARFLVQALHNLYHKRRDNTKQGSRRNIAAHYDLGNDFYQLWLDDTMTYSAALYRDYGESLQAAQVNKYNRILELLDAPKGASIIEIGCGWGGFAHQAASQGYHVDGITLSTEQLKWAQEVAVSAGFEEQVNLSLTDYRDLDAKYDGVVSIEMFEAVGESHWDTYFAKLNQVLKPGANAVLQIITIDDERFHSYRKQADFIQRYVFPGGMLPSVAMLRKKADEHGFELTTQQMFGHDYAQTLREWAAKFEQHWPTIRQQGFDDRFYRLWRYYLAYCEGGFDENSIDVGFFVLTPKA
ncbi:SAM-dependent methyltransferase [Neptunomonas marina]|uniref:Class I SAM-dependent methyltransferase n=1 Tax=Neptunomonas marina TaxID=1815562 RepID=A0A437Q4Q2_9GAMM|nr:cyclopropane-fatty-acyl-phospholipid synthase family protein [Neptunomonas marina]RVU29471.1 class I SAM-dependent methyltransferase [Neptunomonas marina]